MIIRIHFFILKIKLIGIENGKINNLIIIYFQVYIKKL